MCHALLARAPQWADCTLTCVCWNCYSAQVMVYGDCAVNVSPSSQDLASIAACSADTAAAFGIEPRVAMLSYSTMGSGAGPDVSTFVLICAQGRRQARAHGLREGGHSGTRHVVVVRTCDLKQRTPAAGSAQRQQEWRSAAAACMAAQQHVPGEAMQQRTKMLMRVLLCCWQTQVQKVTDAVKLVKEMRPDLMVEGPLQYDAAIDPTVAAVKIKTPSEVAGKATVFIFPDLNTGNNTYKAVQQVSWQATSLVCSAMHRSACLLDHITDGLLALQEGGAPLRVRGSCWLLCNKHKLRMCQANTKSFLSGCC